MRTFLGRMKAKDACPPRKPMPAILWSWLGSLVGIHGLGYWYVLFPVLCESLMLLAVVLVVNNLSRNPHRHYPVYWL